MGNGETLFEKGLGIEMLECVLRDTIPCGRHWQLTHCSFLRDSFNTQKIK